MKISSPLTSAALRMVSGEQAARTWMLKEFGATGASDEAKALALRYARMFREYGVRGRVSLYGKAEFGPFFEAFRFLRARFDGLELIGEGENHSLLARARSTKQESEVERIRSVGQRTIEVVSTS